MKALQFWIGIISGTVLGWLGSEVAGLWGGLLGSIGGAVFAWWAARRIMRA